MCSSWILMFSLMLNFSFSSLINKLKPGIIKKVNRRSTPIAGLVSDAINPVFRCSALNGRPSGVTEVHDGSNRLLLGTILRLFEPEMCFRAVLHFSRCWMFLFIRYTCKCGFLFGLQAIFLMVSHESNCQICPKQQRGKINSDLPPWANDRNRAAGVQHGCCSRGEAVVLAAGVTFTGRPVGCFLVCLFFCFFKFNSDWP